MMSSLFLKALGIWLIIVMAAMANGLFREKILASLFAAKVALALSGLLLSLLVLVVAFIFIPFLHIQQQGLYFAVGVLWVMLTLSFECLFGHFVLGKSWQEIMRVFNLRNGDLFIVVLLLTAAAPWLAAKARGFLLEP